MSFNEFAIQFALYVAVTASGFCLLWLARVFRADWRIHLPPQSIRIVPWTGAGVLGCFLVLFAIHQVLIGLISDRLEDGIVSLLWHLVISSSWLCVGLLIVFLVMYPDEQPVFSAKRRFNNIGIGFAAWTVIAPVTFAVHILIRLMALPFGDDAAQDHTLVVLLRHNANITVLWQFVALEAIICAPLREEFFFRGILQPWIIQRHWGGDLAFALAAIVGFMFRGHDLSLMQALLPVGFVALVFVALLFYERLRSKNPVDPASYWGQLFPPLPADGSIRGPEFRRGMVGVAVLFAMTHSGSWPDPVPLTLLGLALGWLAYRTQSLAAPLVCHALFNAFSLLQLRWDIFFKN